MFLADDAYPLLSARRSCERDGPRAFLKVQEEELSSTEVSFLARTTVV